MGGLPFSVLNIQRNAVRALWGVDPMADLKSPATPGHPSAQSGGHITRAHPGRVSPHIKKDQKASTITLSASSKLSTCNTVSLQMLSVIRIEKIMKQLIGHRAQKTGHAFKSLERTSRTVRLSADIAAITACGCIGAQGASVNLGTATSFGVLGASTVTSTGGTVITGDLGVSPGTALSGFPPGTVSGTIHLGDAFASQARTDALAAYTVLLIRHINIVISV